MSFRKLGVESKPIKKKDEYDAIACPRTLLLLTDNLNNTCLLTCALGQTLPHFSSNISPGAQ